MPFDKINVLIVDDSAFMRKAIENMIAKDPMINVVGHARNGKEAIEKIAELDPDVVTLDIEMPVMDGMEALKIIMRDYPRPVIVVSHLTTEGAKITLDALELGAVDFITKDKTYASFGILKIEEDLVAKIKYFGRRRHKAKLSRKPAPAENEEVKTIKKETTIVAEEEKKVSAVAIEIVGIGTSTGGPQALQRVISKLPNDIGVPILVVQHMPPKFTKSLADRLNMLSKLSVVEAQGKEKLEENVVYIAKGGYHMKVRKVGPHYYTELTNEPRDLLYIPSVDVLFTSIANNYEGNSLGVIMTGMGKDGLLGAKLLKQKGGAMIAQDEDSCVIYGMPKAVVESKLADRVVSLDKIAEEIVKYCAFN
ncbi:MAG: chemotaxis response regulator protein-glutamate methylesterase [Deferribacterota bacterium]|nr:chemotaxis response regulator protein-glutamate methylesterase [Deferribacterota bacterium]